MRISERQPRDLDRRSRMRLRLVVGNAEQDQRRAFGMALVMPFHRHDLGGLMLERVEAVQVADEDLHRRDQRRHPHRHREHLARPRAWLAALEQVPGADAADDQRGGQIGGDHGVHEPIGKARIEDDVEPAPRRHELAVLVHRVAGRRLHPAVHAQDPERGDERADRDHQRGEEMQAACRPSACRTA